MARQIDTDITEKVSLALLTKAAFGRVAGFRYARLAGLPVALITEIFNRSPDNIRHEIQGLITIKDRRQNIRN